MLKQMKIKTILLAFVAVLGLSTGAHATAINWDQILYKLNPVGGLTAAQAQNLSAAIDMTFDSATGLLTVLLTNTSGTTTGTTPNASNLLTGVGFNLPDGVSVIDTAANNSTIAIPDGSMESAGGNSFNQDRWGWGTTIAGHYDEPGVLPVNLILASMGADTDQTFDPPEGNLGGTDWGLLSKTGSPANGDWIKDSIRFSIYLSGVADPTNLLTFIQSEAVVVEYGSPAELQGQVFTPEPASMLLMGAGLMTWGVIHRRRRRQKIRGSSRDSCV